MTPLNTIIEEEKKLVSTLVKVRKGSMDDKQFEATVTHVLTTAMQRAYEAGEREADAKWERKAIGTTKDTVMD